MTLESRQDQAAELPDLSCAPDGMLFDDDGTVRRTGPCVCLPESASIADWPVCASCGLPQKPGKEFCGFCGRRWVSEG